MNRLGNALGVLATRVLYYYYDYFEIHIRVVYDARNYRVLMTEMCPKRLRRQWQRVGDGTRARSNNAFQKPPEAVFVDRIYPQRAAASMACYLDGDEPVNNYTSFAVCAPTDPNIVGEVVKISARHSAAYIIPFIINLTILS